MTGILSLFRRYFRRSSESGQSIVLLGLGFVMLAGFVGITTDISLMFVRYAQLSRAVDSAAIAAANQMRQDRSNASVQLAARQFIEFYGLSPQQVIVDTCLTTNYKDTDLNCPNDTQSKLVRVRAYFRQPTVFISLIGIHWFDMWVSATSQTAALDVVLVMDVSESMAAQTGYDDWAKTEKLGNSPGVILRTTNFGTIYRPPTTDEILNRYSLNDPNGDVLSKDFWTVWKDKGVNGAPMPGLLQNQQSTVNKLLTFYNKAGGSPTDREDNAIPASDLTWRKWFRVDYVDNYFTSANGYTGIKKPTRKDCRVAFYPRAKAIPLYERGRMRGLTNADGTYKSYLELLQDPAVKLQVTDLPTNYVDPVTGQIKDFGTLNGFDGFVPVYNFYGCCNDPDFDLHLTDPVNYPPGGFDDLVCQPFKQVRNATFDFLERIDFLRGDRAAFVTYDRTAFLVNPWVPANNGYRPSAMLDDKTVAYHTLKNLIGVRAEPFFYAMTNIQNGAGKDPTLITQWSGFSAGVNSTGGPNEVDYRVSGVKAPDNLQGYVPTDPAAPQVTNYPVFDNCSVQNATLESTRSLFPNGLANSSLPSELQPEAGDLTMGYDTAWRVDPTNRTNGDLREPFITNPGVMAGTPPTLTYTAASRTGYAVDDVSYEYWAACRNGNIGAALREANNALVDINTSRQFGTIWIIILMSDGGAGASDPVRKNGELLKEAQPYKINAKTGTYGIPGEYGAFGLCPIGTPNNPGEVVLYGNDYRDFLNTPPIESKASSPFCADEDAASRHVCDFRPLLLLPTNALNFKNYRDSGRDPMWDDFFLQPGETNDKISPTQTAPTGMDKEQTRAWNKQRNHFYDVDIGPKGTFVVNGYTLNEGGCDPLYDVEDYARDWADYIATANLQSASGNAQVPTIFTIGFGLKFSTVRDNNAKNGTLLVTDQNLPITDPVNINKAQENVYILCRRNITNCLGEQLLRYIADVGDNNRIDNDYYQDLMSEWYQFNHPDYKPGVNISAAINGKVLGLDPLAPLTFGTRDACQTQVDLSGKTIAPVNFTYDTNGNNKLDGLDISGKNAGVPDTAYNHYDNYDARGRSEVDSINNQNTEFGREYGQLRGNMSCGNYYYSPTAEELQFVFDDIASRMFTRLSR